MFILTFIFSCATRVREEERKRRRGGEKKKKKKTKRTYCFETIILNSKLYERRAVGQICRSNLNLVHLGFELRC